MSSPDEEIRGKRTESSFIGPHEHGSGALWFVLQHPRRIRDVVAFEPINAYGRSKKYAETYLLKNYDQNALIILRSSVITGPQPPFRRVDRPLFLDFIAKTCPPNTQGRNGEGEENEEVKDENAVEFWTDEFRNPVSRIDLTEAIVYCFEIFVGLRRKRDVSMFLFEEEGERSIELLFITADRSA